MLGLRTLLRSYARLDRATNRVQDNVRRFTGAILGQALTSREQAELSIAIYDALSQRHGPADKPHPFELPWWNEALPARGSRVLVGACGDGRELLLLAELGYRVDGFEPAAAAVSVCRRRAGTDSTIARGTYADFVAAVEGDADDPSMAAISRRRYDAVLLGWGSLGHVLADRDRRALLRACDTVCPAGPLLATFWLGKTLQPQGRTGSLGRALGDRIARARGIQAGEDGVGFGPWFGFNRTFSRAEIEALGASVGRATRWGDAAHYPHVTWQVRSSGDAAP